MDIRLLKIYKHITQWLVPQHKPGDILPDGSMYIGFSGSGKSGASLAMLMDAIQLFNLQFYTHEERVKKCPKYQSLCEIHFSEIPVSEL